MINDEGNGENQEAQEFFSTPEFTEISRKLSELKDDQPNVNKTTNAVDISNGEVNTPDQENNPATYSPSDGKREIAVTEQPIRELDITTELADEMSEHWIRDSINLGQYKSELHCACGDNIILDEHANDWRASYTGVENHHIAEKLKHLITSAYLPKSQVAGMVREARIAVAQLILNTCKYAGRELFLSTGAVENLLADLKSGSDDHKVFTALAKVEATLQQDSEAKND